MIHDFVLMGLLLGGPQATNDTPAKPEIDPIVHFREEKGSGCLLATPEPHYFPAEYEAGYYEVRFNPEQRYARLCLLLDQAWVENAVQVEVWMYSPQDTIRFERGVASPNSLPHQSPILLQEFIQWDDATHLQGLVRNADGSCTHLNLAEGLLPRKTGIPPRYWQISLQIQ